MGLLLGVLYLWLAYWAAGQTIYYNKILIGDFFLRRVTMGAILGFVLIPYALVLKLIGRR